MRNDYFFIWLGFFQWRLLKDQNCRSRSNKPIHIFTRIYQTQKSGLSERIRIHSCLYTENMILYTESWRATACRIVQNQLALTHHNPFRSYSSEDSDERVVIDQPLLDQKSFKRSVVHNSSCGEVHWISSTLAMYSRDESLPPALMYFRTSARPSTAL